MIRRTASLSGRKWGMSEEGVNPLESVANMSDIMLVLAVALMLALVMHWGVDMSAAAKVDPTDAEKTEDVTEEEIVDSTSGKAYKEIGKVYLDPDTGETYYIKGS